MKRTTKYVGLDVHQASTVSSVREEGGRVIARTIVPTEASAIVEFFRGWSDGTYQIVLSPEELLEKLAALVPPPRLNLVRYHGVLAPNAADRAQIVPGPKEEVEAPAECTGEGEEIRAQRRHRLAWAVLLARVFQFDVTKWPACGGRMKIVAAVTDAGSSAPSVGPGTIWARSAALGASSP